MAPSPSSSATGLPFGRRACRFRDDCTTDNPAFRRNDNVCTYVQARTRSRPEPRSHMSGETTDVRRGEERIDHHHRDAVFSQFDRGYHQVGISILEALVPTQGEDVDDVE